MLPTPDTDHIDPNTTYSPAEDSYLVLDTLTSDAGFLHSHFAPPSSPPLILELGTGSGIISAFISTNTTALFGRADVHLLGTDANSIACAATAQTLSLTPAPSHFLGALVADLAAPLRDHVVDMLVFNPPYVPTPELPSLRAEHGATEFEEESRLLALTYAGGEDGMEVTRRVLMGLGSVLSQRGVAYILLCRSNRPGEVVEGLRGQGWRCEKAGGSGRRGGIERLEIWRIWR
ncbi:hypothetical protein BZA05DRAFT_411976 [Tricharina praecox]|uniref:uncharacterized protein n=1 Tax=Tricharina praecox TaxID=43433 RepID=UPI002220230B|nr:uncharacterized protein BZA05DRAFT_411976 [Tricharina praecox]KAI5842694.1 hypothetical protein BZA05DRAFT_411976 [Tricharina praecox]